MEREYCCLSCSQVVVADKENEQYGAHQAHWFNLEEKNKTAVCPQCGDFRGLRFLGTFCGSCGVRYVQFRG